MPHIWVVDQASDDQRMVGLNCRSESVEAVKAECARTFHYDGPLYAVDGVEELVDVKESVVVKGKYCHTKQLPLYYGKTQVPTSGFYYHAKRGCSKKAICIWTLATMVAVGGYVATHWAHVKDYAGDMPFIMNLY